MRVLRLEVSIYNVYITIYKLVSTHFSSRGGGVKSVCGGDWEVNSKEENSNS
jgi:hypothetical protein